MKQEKKNKKLNLQKLADEITSGVKKSGWDDIDVIKWQRKRREDRDVNVHS